MTRTLSILAVCLLTASLAFAQDSPVDRKLQSPVPDGFILSSNSPVSDPSNEHADNVGAPLDRLAELYALTGANTTGIGYSWGECEPAPPVGGQHTYTWKEDPDSPFLKIPGLEKTASIDVTCEWAEELRKTDKDTYWTYLENYVAAAATHARERWGARYFRVPGNEPSLYSVAKNPFYKPEYADWHFWYMDRAIHVARGIKRANPENQVIFGQLVVGDYARIGALAQAGLTEHKELFDILDIHCYSPDPEVHVDMNQIIESREALDTFGCQHIRLMFGEGWSCFPLPPHIDGNLAEAATYTQEDVNHYRNCLFSGWYNIRTPRPGEYDPAWVVGANYFTFCDLLEGRGWRRRAIPVHDDAGNIVEYRVDGYRKMENELGPFFRPWGIIDIEGKPKGDLHLEFPPYIPKYELTTAFVAYPGNAVKAGQAYRVRVRFTNNEDEDLTGVRFSIAGRRKYGREISGSAQSEAVFEIVKAGESREAEFDVVFGPERVGQISRYYAVADFAFRDRPYTVDAWGAKINVTD